MRADGRVRARRSERKEDICIVLLRPRNGYGLSSRRSCMKLFQRSMVSSFECKIILSDLVS